MFENDRSAARGKMAVRKLIIFRHESELGCAPAYRLFDAVKVERKQGVEVTRSFLDYDIIMPADLPEGVSLTCRE